MIDKQLTQNFSIDEFKCHDGTSVPWDLLDNVKKLAKNLQVLRDELGVPVRIISGYRNPTYNAKIGGAKRSLHMKALAGDIKVKGHTPAEVHSKVLELIASGRMEQGGVGVYRTFVHYDCRGTKARWKG